jgi:hypothetical protein
MQRLPAASCAATSRATSTWRPWSLPLLAWLQSTISVHGSLAPSISLHAAAIEAAS